MNSLDIYNKSIDYVAERSNHKLSRFINVPTKEYNGMCFIAFEGSNLKETWNPERDWNQLMLVVDEIEKIKNIKVNIIGSTCKIDKTDENQMLILCSHNGESRLESVYRCCVDFIDNVAIR